MLPGILALGWLLARLVTKTQLLAALVAPVFALALWMESAHLTAYGLHSFYLGMWIVTPLLGLAGYAGLWHARPSTRAFARLSRDKGTRWMLLTGLLVTALIAPVVLGAAFHDEIGVAGHLAMSSTIQNGTYPPRDLGFPEQALRYHHGYDLVCAMVSSIFRVNVSVAGDMVSLANWFNVWVLAWTIGRRLGGPWGGPVTSLTVLYGAGYPFFCPSQVKSPELGAQLLGFCTFDGMLRNSPVTSNFFQHPWTVGLPLSLCVLLVADVAPRGRARWLAIGGFVAALGIGQVVMFASLAAALPVAEALRRKQDRLRSTGFTLLAVVAAVLLATHTGGFFAPGPTGLELELHVGIARSASGSVEWMVRVFGLLLVFGIAGHFLARRPSHVWGLLALGGIVVLNTVRYKHTWDIVKFAVVTTVGLAVPSGVLIARAIGSKVVKWRAGGGVALFAVTLSGLAFHAALLFRLPGVPPMYRRQPPGIAYDDANAAGWLRQHMPMSAAMYRNQGHYLGYAVWGGLPQAWFDERAMGSIVGAAERQKLLRTLPEESEPYRAQGVRFFVLEEGDGRLLQSAMHWVETGAAVDRATFGRLRVIELVEPSPS
jgi:hypothetical protein